MRTPVDRKTVEERLRSLREEGLVTGLAIQRDGEKALVSVSAETDSGSQGYNAVEVALVKNRLAEALQDIPFDILGLSPPSERAALPQSELYKVPPVGAERRQAELVMLAAERLRSLHAEDTVARHPRPTGGNSPAAEEPTPLQDAIPADRESADLSGEAIRRLTATAELALHETRNLASRLSELEQETKALPTRRFVYREGMIILVILAGLIAFQPEFKAAIAEFVGWIGSFVSGLVR
jgi:hypothetical protein